VRDRPEKPLISIFTARVKGWNLGIGQCENIWHSNGNRIDDTDGSTLYLPDLGIESWKDCGAKPLNSTPTLGR